jgi:flagellar basal-body rod modification protein FlgD
MSTISGSTALSNNQASASSAVFDNINGTSTKATTENSVTEDRFLKLLVAQMQNQDPLNPMENAEVTSQMAQISTVNGIESLNKTLAKYIEQSSPNRAVNAVGMIGQDVLVNGTKIDWRRDDGPGLRLGLDMPAEADQVKLEVLDQGGVVVNSLNLGRRAAGTHSVVWDGRADSGAVLPDGQYSLRVAATSAGRSVDATTLTAQRVMGVVEATGSDGKPVTQVQTADGQTRAADSVRGIFRPL